VDRLSIGFRGWKRLERLDTWWIHGSGLTDEITNTLGVYGLDGVKDVMSSGFVMYSSLYITLTTSSGLPFSYESENAQSKSLSNPARNLNPSVSPSTIYRASQVLEIHLTRLLICIERREPSLDLDCAGASAESTNHSVDWEVSNTYDTLMDPLAEALPTSRD